MVRVEKDSSGYGGRAERKKVGKLFSIYGKLIYGRQRIFQDYGELVNLQPSLSTSYSVVGSVKKS